jgi:hypothetical protein
VSRKKVRTTSPINQNRVVPLVALVPLLLCLNCAHGTCTKGQAFHAVERARKYKGSSKLAAQRRTSGYQFFKHEARSIRSQPPCVLHAVGGQGALFSTRMSSLSVDVTLLNVTSEGHVCTWSAPQRFQSSSSSSSPLVHVISTQQRCCAWKNCVCWRAIARWHREGRYTSQHRPAHRHHFV